MRNVKKIILPFLLTAFLALALGKQEVIVKAVSSWQEVDVNNDGKIDSGDVSLAFQFLGCPAFGDCPSQPSSPIPTPEQSPQPTPSPGQWAPCGECHFGTQIIGDDSGQFILDIASWPGFVFTGSVSTGAEYYPQLPGWTRGLGGGTLDHIRNKHNSAIAFNIGDQYECLVYGPEFGHGAGEEALHPEVNVVEARAIANEAGKCLMYAPAVADYEQHIPDQRGISAEELIPTVAQQVDMWGIQLGSRQEDVDEGRMSVDDFKNWLSQWVNWIKTGNSGVKIIVQMGIGERDPINNVCLPPQSAEYILEWRQRMVDLIDGIIIMPAQPCQPCPPNPSPGFPCSNDPMDNQYYRESLQVAKQAVTMVCGQ